MSRLCRETVSCLGHPSHHSIHQQQQQHLHHHHLDHLNFHQKTTVATMLPFDSFYEPQPKPRFYFKMPRVVPDQKSKFESDELFRRLSRESEVRYTGYRDRPLEERQMRFQNGCREGHTEIFRFGESFPNKSVHCVEVNLGFNSKPPTKKAFVATGTNLQLVFNPATNGYANDIRDCDFDKEPGKVHLRSHFIMNGVCVRWRGWLDLERLDGVGCLEYDEEAAQIEDAGLREQIERYNQRLREFEEKHGQRTYCGQQERGVETELEVSHLSRKKAEVATGHGHAH